MLEDYSILVVDDSVAVRRFVVSALKNMFNCRRIHETKSANEALRLMESGEKVDWIFSDWEMPGISGVEFLIKVRSDPATENVPFVMITSHNDKDSIVTALQAGVTDYLVKPFSAETFSQKVRRVMILWERRVMERFNARTKNRVDIKVTKHSCVPANLENISMSGCLLRSRIFKNSDIDIYDIVRLEVHFNGDILRVDGRLVRMEKDHEEPMLKKFIMAAFEFVDIDDRLKKELEKLIETVREELPMSPE